MNMHKFALTTIATFALALTALAAPALTPLLPSDPNYKIAAQAAKLQIAEYEEEFASEGFDIECGEPDYFQVYGNFSAAIDAIAEEQRIADWELERLMLASYGFDLIFSTSFDTGSDGTYALVGVAQLPSTTLKNAVWFVACQGIFD
jgi:hypothetical protein